MTDLAKTYQEAKAALDQARERLEDLQKAHPELESVEVYQDRIAHAKQDLALYEKKVKENGEASTNFMPILEKSRGKLRP